MKTTAKEYKSNYELLRVLGNWKHEAKLSENWTVSFELGRQIDELNAMFFDILPTVNIRYSIGGRRYYEAVAKIGKSYFSNGRSMTKGNGHWFIEEITTITSQMQNDMLSDSYYY